MCARMVCVYAYVLFNVHCVGNEADKHCKDDQPSENHREVHHAEAVSLGDGVVVAAAGEHLQRHVLGLWGVGLCVKNESVDVGESVSVSGLEWKVESRE
jgi:hypothetical protein